MGEKRIKGVALGLQVTGYVKHIGRLSLEPLWVFTFGASERNQLSELEGEPVPIVLERVRAQSGAQSWKFSQKTVGRVRALYEAEDRRSLEQRMPDVLTGRTVWGLAPWQWIGLPVLVVASWALASAIASRIILREGTRLLELLCAWGASSRKTGMAAAVGPGEDADWMDRVTGGVGGGWETSETIE